MAAAATQAGAATTAAHKQAGAAVGSTADQLLALIGNLNKVGPQAALAGGEFARRFEAVGKVLREAVGEKLGPSVQKGIGISIAEIAKLKGVSENAARAMVDQAQAAITAEGGKEGALKKTQGATGGLLGMFRQLFTSAGTDAGKFGQVLMGLGGMFVATGKEGQGALGSLQGPLAAMQDGLAKVGATVRNILVVDLAGKLEGLVRAGLGASAMGQVLSFQLERLALAAGGVFGPELQKLVELVGRAADWISSLTNEQKALIVHLIEGAAAALAVSKVLPLLFVGIQAVVVGIGELIVALAAVDVESGGILPAIGAVVTALLPLAAVFAGVAVGAGVSSGALGDLWKALKPLADAIQGTFKGLLGAMAPGLAALRQSLAGLTKSLEPAFAAIGEWLKVIGPAFGRVLAVAAEAVAVLIDSLQPLADWISQLFTVSAEGAPAWGELWQAAADLAETLIELGGVIISTLMPLLRPLMDFFLTLAKIIENQVITAIRVLAGWIQNLAWALRQVFGISGRPIAVTKEKEEDRDPLARRMGGPESIEAIWTRLASKSVLVGTGAKTPEQEQLDEMKEINKNTKDTADAVKGQRPIVKAA